MHNSTGEEKSMATDNGAAGYMEISSKEGVGIFDLVCKIGTQHHKNRSSKTRNKCFIL